jgi:hypothetical protein
MGQTKKLDFLQGFCNQSTYDTKLFIICSFIPALNNAMYSLCAGKCQVRRSKQVDKETSPCSPSYSLVGGLIEYLTHICN